MAVKANSAVQSSAAESSSNRRTIIKGAAWSVPVIAAAIAAPAASASGEPVIPPVFNDWSIGGSASVGNGNNGFMTVNGQSADGEDASVPAGFTFSITPDAGVVLVINSSPGFMDIVEHPDGRITGNVVPDFPGKPRINFKVTGPVDAKITMLVEAPFAPFQDVKVLTVTR